MEISKNICVFMAIITQLIAMTNAFPQEFPVLGADPCTRGPGHWCESMNNAITCGQGAYEHCLKNVLEQNQNQSPLLGSNPCTFGPSAICKSFELAQRCGATFELCRSQVGSPVEASLETAEFPVLGADPCTRGPGHWCESMNNAITCGQGAYDHCLRNVLQQNQNQSPLLGSNPCTFGPSAICKSFELAQRCGATFELCRSQVGSPVGASLGSAAPNFG